MKKQLSNLIQKKIEVVELNRAFKNGLQPLIDFRTISHRIFYYANKGFLRGDFIRKVSKLLLDFSNCDEIEIWQKEHKKYYQGKMLKRRKKPFQFSAITEDEFNKIATNNSNLEYLCYKIINGLPYTVSSFITENGSFWTGDTHKIIVLGLKYDQGTHYYNLANKRYKSLAIIPVKISNETIGLLQLKSKKLNYFCQEEIKFYEGIAQIIGDALVTRRVRVSLRARVKELSCLYGIAKLVEKPGLTLDEILLGIANLLPTAMLYPDIASARIEFDGNYYSTPSFENIQEKLSTAIIIDGKRRGTVEVGYIEPKVALDEGLFLKEERDLIDTVARELVLIVERRKTAEDREKLQEQLRQADRLATIGQLAAGVVHELNEPLANILGFAQLVKKYSNLPKQVTEDIDKIINASLHAREVIKKLLFFARKMPPQKVPVNLNQLVEDGLYFLLSRCQKENIEVIRTLAPDLPEIIADPAQLYQVLVNLVVNAIQAMPKGGKLTIQTITGDGYVSLIVADTGIGMSQETLKQIFTPFFSTKPFEKEPVSAYRWCTTSFPPITAR